MNIFNCKIEENLVHHSDTRAEQRTVIILHKEFHFVQILVLVKEVGQNKKIPIMFSHWNVLCLGAITLNLHVLINSSSIFQLLKTG
jgi:hypothetical protein